MIVECPGCQSRYDVTGRPAGAKARCRCGTVFVLPEAAVQASMLECPRCSGSVAATNHNCEFCGVELMVKACPRCFAKIFRGAKHCSHCGAGVVTPAAASPEGNAVARMCPRCSDRPSLEARLVSDVLLDECLRCHGIFMDTDALERVLTERRQARAEAILGALCTLAGSSAPAQPQQQGPMYIRCPVCQSLMNRRSFALGSRVIVDVCRSHGTWFDPDELPQIIDFVMKGGLEQAERRQLEREREQIRQERISARASSSPGMGVPGSGSWAQEPIDGSISLIGLFEAIRTIIQGVRTRSRDS